MMKAPVTLICMCLALVATIRGPALYAQTSELIDYQNYNHGYCPTCDGPGCAPCEDDPSCDPYSSPGMRPTPPCAPCGPGGCGTPLPPPGAPCSTCPPAAPCDPCAAGGGYCGIPFCAIGIGLVAIGVAAAIIVSSGNGNTPN